MFIFHLRRTITTEKNRHLQSLPKNDGFLTYHIVQTGQMRRMTVTGLGSSSRCCFLQVSNLFNQVVLLISELLIIRPFFLKAAQKLNEFGLIL